MRFQIVMNAAIAAIWMLFNNSFTLQDAVWGWIVGLIVVAIFIYIRQSPFYLRRVWAMLKLMTVFLKEIIVANANVIRIVLSPRMNITPGILAVPTKLRTETEKAVLAACIALTPGSMCIEFSTEEDILYIHFLNIRDREKTIRLLLNKFEKGIMEVLGRV